MKYHLSILTIIIITFLLFTSCNQEPSISEKDFIKIYADMTIMQDTSKISQEQIRQTVLSRYKYNDDDYDKTIQFYNADKENWTKFFDKVIDYVENLRNSTKKKEPLVLPKLYVLKDN